MAPDRIAALRRVRATLLDFCRDLDDSEWNAPSRADGWRVQDVVAHLGSVCHALFSPSAMGVMRTDDVEAANDVLVDQRRSWTPARTLAEYERWSKYTSRLASLVVRTPAANIQAPLPGLGRFPIALMLTGAMVFDHHTHLRHDIAPAIGRPGPDVDADQMAVTLEWMMAVLGNQLQIAPPHWLNQPVSIELRGPGGGNWLVRRDGTVQPGRLPAGTQIIATALEFPDWGTRRSPWRERDVAVTGDVEAGARLLDALNIV